MIDLQEVELWWEDVRDAAKDVDNCPDVLLRIHAGYLVKLVLHAAEQDSHVTKLIAQMRELEKPCFS